MRVWPIIRLYYKGAGPFLLKREGWNERWRSILSREKLKSTSLASSVEEKTGAGYEERCFFVLRMHVIDPTRQTKEEKKQPGTTGLTCGGSAGENRLDALL